MNSIPKHLLQMQFEQMLTRCDLNFLTEINPKTLTSGIVSASVP